MLLSYIGDAGMLIFPSGDEDISHDITILHSFNPWFFFGWGTTPILNKNHSIFINYTLLLLIAILLIIAALVIRSPQLWPPCRYSNFDVFMEYYLVSSVNI